MIESLASKETLKNELSKVINDILSLPGVCLSNFNLSIEMEINWSNVKTHKD